MNWPLVLNVILVVVATALAVFFIMVLNQLTKTLSSINEFVKEINRDVPPLLTKLQTTIDEVNDELGRVDEIVQSVQEVSEKVSVTSRIVQEIISSPLIKVASFSAGAKKAFDTLVGKKQR